MTAELSRTPAIRLDPLGRDHHGEATRLRAAGPVARVILPGDVPAWAVTRHAELEALLRDRRFSASYRNWRLWQDGRITPDWPLYGMFCVDNMFTSDGADHRRLRSPVQRVLTGRKVEAMRPAITTIAAKLLDDLPGRAGAHGTVDLKQDYAVALPMAVVSGRVMGLPQHWWPRLRVLVEDLFRTGTDTAAAGQDRIQLLQDLIALRTAEPGDDLTSDLIADRHTAADPMTDTELADTIWIMLTAGHETTVSLITGTIRAVLTHPRQRRNLGNWDEVIEEVLRQDPPIGILAAGYTTTATRIAGVTIPAGECVLACYGAAGRDPARHGPRAHLFDPARDHAGHLAFSAGPHACPGSLLARLETQIAVHSLFTRYPRLSLAVRPGRLQPVESFFTNSVRTLPARLTPRPWTRHR